ncbi:hypothetical protein Barb6_02225 [Bacteroidales bacterium Barb6]|nr:hypothetical protein Barb6_02225 [Bacteroidales bacterium Barb6]
MPPSIANYISHSIKQVRMRTGTDKGVHTLLEYIGEHCGYATITCQIPAQTRIFHSP